MRRIETVIVVLALAFYVWFLSHFGTREVLGYIRLAGWGLILTISLETFARLANTLGWWVTIVDYSHGLRFGQLFLARIAGEAVDYTTPSAQLGGQFVMAMMVRRNLEMAAGLSTAIIAALCEMIGQIGFITLALLMSIRLVPRTSDFFWAILGGFALALALIGGFFFVQRKHPFSYLIAGASKLPGIDADEYRNSAAKADQILLEFYAHHRVRLALSSLCYLFAWSLGPIEIFILLRLLHQPASVEIVLLIEGVGLLLERATFLIPAKLVSQEGGKALIVALLGYPAGVGFAIGFLRRIKEMVWVLFGLLSLMIHRLRMRKQSVDSGLGAGRNDKIVGLRMKAEEPR